MTERVVMAVEGPADRLLAAGLRDLEPVLDHLRGNVVLVGGLMTRLWLHLRPVEDIPPRATADIDLGVDRHGLGLTSSSTVLGPLLETREYHPLPGEESFRFRKSFGDAGALLVDLLMPKGQSREEPPVLEKGISTVAAPGLVYALSRGPYFVGVTFVDGATTTRVEVPLPTLDAAFVLKAALVASGVRMRADRRERDRVDALMLAAACADDADAVLALAGTTKKEARTALSWLSSALPDPGSAVARTIEAYLREQHGLPDGGAWAVDAADRLLARVREAAG